MNRAAAPTAAQVRQACALLHWSSPRLSTRARVSYEVARKARTDVGMPTLHFMDQRAIRECLEAAGVEFEEDGSVRLKEKPSP